MRVKMKTRYAGPLGCCPPDGVIDLPADEAKGLIDGGYATPEKAQAQERAIAPPAVETAVVIAPTADRTVVPRGRKPQK